MGNGMVIAGRRGRTGRRPADGSVFLVALAALLLGAVVMIRPALAQDYEAVSRLLDQAVATAERDGASVTVTRPGGRSIMVGEPVELTLSARRDSDVLLLVVDALGHVQAVIPPVGAAGDGRIGGGTAVPFPPPSSGATLAFSPPLGPTRLLLVGLPPGVLEGAGFREIDGQILPPEGLQPLTQRLAAVTQEMPVSVASQELEIVGRADGPELAARDIVDYFTTRSRSIGRPALDQAIEFAFGSADLTSESRENLQAWIEALKDPELSGDRFILEGHTDDIGSESYNMDLSLRRAQAVLDHLVTSGGLAAGRFEVVPQGESRPMVPNSDDAARARNRRVVFQLM